MSYSIAQLQNIAQEDIKKLIHIIEHSGSNINALKMAIEVLGEEADNEEIILPILNRFLKHIHVSVRESAMISITSFYRINLPPKAILDRLRVISNNDPSSYLREFAKDMLNEFK